MLLVQSSSLCVRLPDLFFRTARRWSNTFRNFFHPYLSSVSSVWSVSDPQCDIYHHFMLWLASCEVSEEPRFDPLSQDRRADCSTMTAVKSLCPLTTFPRPWLKISWGQGKKWWRTYKDLYKDNYHTMSLCDDRFHWRGWNSNTCCWKHIFLYLACVFFLCWLMQVYIWTTLKEWEEEHMLMGGREEAYGETCQHSFIMTPHVILWPSKV